MNRIPDVHLLTGAYAVDGLSADERERFEIHLEECFSCRREVAQLQSVAARLGAVARERPPAALRERVLEEIDHTPQEPTDSSSGTATTP